MTIDHVGEVGYQPTLGGRDQLQVTVVIVAVLVVAVRCGRVRT